MRISWISYLLSICKISLVNVSLYDFHVSAFTNEFCLSKQCGSSSLMHIQKLFHALWQMSVCKILSRQQRLFLRGMDSPNTDFDHLIYFLLSKYNHLFMSIRIICDLSFIAFCLFFIVLYFLQTRFYLQRKVSNSRSFSNKNVKTRLNNIIILNTSIFKLDA